MHLHQFSSSSFNISGAAGLITSINRIITKLVLHNEKTNTLIFFVLSAAIVLVCLLTHHLARKSDFIRYYTAACNAASTAEDQQHLTLNDQVRRLHPHSCLVLCTTPTFYPSIFLISTRVGQKVVRPMI